ncbi:hypothetical protein [Streptomyces sp. NPDC057257]|uniref:hypothetical protein n=1 Tax=Streptomyces sp. NPDC057257 TaxID=3346071 RepID=UPI003636FAD5
MTAVSGDATGDRSIVVGRDAIQSILITGDHNRVFVGEYELLRDAYIEPWSVFQRVDVEGFVGREWLLAEIDRFLATEDRGYFVLEASAGLGKTAFLAHLVQQRGYVHHFVETARGPDGVAPALRSLAAQVIRAAELLPFSVDEVLPSTAGSRPDFFAHLLKRASDRRAGEHDRLVIVVDGLDEAGVPIGHNVLGLPEVLPPGVYVVVSQRPVPVPLDTQSPLRVFSMDAAGDPNLGDMRRYLQRAVASPPLAAVVRDSAYTPAEVVETLVARSAGVWIYLHYVLADVVRERRVDLDVLPDGLWAYYARFWRRWRGERREEWYGTFLPLLATLAAVQQDVTADLLATLAGTDGGPALTALLDEDWLPFLAVDEVGGERRYRPYHASVREFLEGRLDRTGRRAMDVALAREFEQAVRVAHGRIADRYLRRWGSLEHGLDRLLTGSEGRLDGGYGLRHLAAHLAGAGRHGELERLLRLEADGRNVWFSAQDLTGELSAYQADVARAWRLAEDRGVREPGSGGTVDIAAEARWALYTSSVNALAGSVPPTLLVGLVRAGVWSPAKGLAYARQTLDTSARAEMLAGLAGVTPASLQLDLLGAVEALDEWHRADALAELAESLPEILLSRAVHALEGTESYRLQAATVRLATRLGRLGRWEEAFQSMTTCPEAQPRAFAVLACELPDDRLDAALHLTTAVADPDEKVRALTALLPRLGADQSAEAWRALLDVVDGVAPVTLIAALPAMRPRPWATGVLTDTIERWDRPWARSRGLAALAAQVPDGERGSLVERALAHVGEIEVAVTRQDDGWGRTIQGPELGLFERADALGALLPLVVGDMRAAVLAEAVAVARVAFTTALEELCEHGGWTHVSRLFSPRPSERTTGHGPWVGAAPMLLFRRLPDADGRELVESVLAKAEGIPKPSDRATVLGHLFLAAPLAYLDGILARLLTAFRAIDDPEKRCDGLLEILHDVTGPARDRVIADIIDTLRHREFPDRLRILNDLAPSLAPQAVATALPGAADWTPDHLPRAVEHVGALIPHLPPGTVDRVIEAARRVDDLPAQLAAAAGLAPYLPAERRAAVVARAVRFRDDPENEGEYSFRHGRILARLARALAEQGHADEAIDVAAVLWHRDNTWPSQRHDTLTDVARVLAPARPAEALRAVARITRADERSRALWAVLSLAPDTREALALVRTELGEDLTPRDLAALEEDNSWNPDDETDDPPGDVPDILARARRAQGHRRADLIAAVARRLDVDQALSALDLAENIPDEYAYENAVAALAARLVALGRTAEATAAVLRLTPVDRGWEDSPRTAVLVRHVPVLAGHGYLDEARRVIDYLPSHSPHGEPHRADALTLLARRYVETGALDAGMHCALSIPEDEERSGALAAVAESAAALPPTALLHAVRTVLSRAPTLPRSALLTDLAAFAPVLVRIGGRRAAADLADAIDDVTRWWP